MPLFKEKKNSQQEGFGKAKPSISSRMNRLMKQNKSFWKSKNGKVISKELKKFWKGIWGNPDY